MPLDFGQCFKLCGHDQYVLLASQPSLCDLTLVLLVLIWTNLCDLTFLKSAFFSSLSTQEHAAILQPLSLCGSNFCRLKNTLLMQPLSLHSLQKHAIRNASEFWRICLNMLINAASELARWLAVPVTNARPVVLLPFGQRAYPSRRLYVSTHDIVCSRLSCMHTTCGATVTPQRPTYRGPRLCP